MAGEAIAKELAGQLTKERIFEIASENGIEVIAAGDFPAAGILIPVIVLFLCVPFLILCVIPVSFIHVQRCVFLPSFF